jgi:uncharacterized protein YqeY
MKAAMRGGEKARLGVIRMIMAAIKQRLDSIEQFRAGSREDLAEREQAEVEVLEAYLPRALTADEIESLVTEAVAATGASSMRDMGRVMGEVKARATGRLDMAKASELVKARLGG